MAAITSHDPNELLNVEAVCRVLKVSRRTVYTLIERGELTRLKVGQATRFRRSAITAYVNRIERKATR